MRSARGPAARTPAGRRGAGSQAERLRASGTRRPRMLAGPARSCRSAGRRIRTHPSPACRSAGRRPAWPCRCARAWGCMRSASRAGGPHSGMQRGAWGSMRSACGPGARTPAWARGVWLPCGAHAGRGGPGSLSTEPPGLAARASGYQGQGLGLGRAGFRGPPGGPQRGGNAGTARGRPARRAAPPAAAGAGARADRGRRG